MISLLIERIWPAIREELPSVQLHIYGSGLSKELLVRKKELERQGIVLKGVMEDTQDIQKYRALLYPSRWATGSKGAVVESWFQHTPVVTTPVGAEGLFMETSEPLFSAGDRGQVSEGFFKERELTKEEKTGR